jgi:hypothetical protein
LNPSLATASLKLSRRYFAVFVGVLIGALLRASPVALAGFIAMRCEQITHE